MIDSGGQITIGTIGPIECAITATDDRNALMMLQRRNGETVPAHLH